MSTLLPFIKSHRAMSEAAARMGAGQSARYSDWWNELAWVHRQAADDLQRQMEEGCDKYGNVENFGPVQTDA